VIGAIALTPYAIRVAIYSHRHMDCTAVPKTAPQKRTRFFMTTSVEDKRSRAAPPLQKIACGKRRETEVSNHDALARRTHREVLLLHRWNNDT
jgi:hypothetical protein